MKGEFDMESFTAAFEAVDVERILGYYSEDFEHTEIDAEAPPREPRVSGRDDIRAAFEGIAQAGIKLHIDNPVVARDRAACTITVEFPGGGMLKANTIFHLEGDQIARQLDVQVSDPS
jgi:SnoaL-like domain